MPSALLVAVVGLALCGSRGNGALLAITPAQLTVQQYAQVVLTVAQASGTASYQWMHDGVNVPQQTSRVFVLEAAQITDAGVYQVNVSTSNSWQLSQNATLVVEYEPQIITQPAPLSTVVPGDSLNLSVVAVGVPTPTYSWQLNGATLTSASASTATLHISSVTSDNTGHYTVNICNSQGCTDSEEADVRVYSAPSFLVGLSGSQNISQGQPLSLSVSAAGLPFPTFQWYHNGEALFSQNKTSLQIAALLPSDDGVYYVMLSNFLANVTSGGFYLHVVVPPNITQSPTSAIVNWNTSYTLTVQATGDAPLVYQWMKNGASISGANLATFTISNADASDVGAYSVTVTNSAGQATSQAANVTVRMPPTILVQPSPSYVKAQIGQSVSFFVEVKPQADTAITYAWLVNGVNAPNGTNWTFTYSASLAGTFEVQVLVTNAAGSATSSAVQVTVAAASAASRVQRMNLAIILGAAVGGGCAILLALILLCVVYCRRRRRQRKDTEEKKWLGTLVDKTFFDDAEVRRRFFEICPGPDYENPDRVDLGSILQPPQLDSTRLEIRKKLATGGAIEVRSGLLHGDDATADVPVMVKVLRQGADPAMQTTFMLEAYMYHNLKHKNIVSLIGVVTTGPAWAMALELPAYGRLKQLLQRQDVSEVYRRQYALDIASAMTFLASHRVIHRALMAAHVIVTHHNVAKIAEFGYVRRLAKSMDQYDSVSGFYALPWAPLEAVISNTFVAKSDVWSFGVLMYEIWTDGAEPYTAPSCMVDRLKEGERLGPSPAMGYTIYKLMIECWHPNPALRPEFSQIEERLQALAQKSSRFDSQENDIHAIVALQNTYRTNYIQVTEIKNTPLSPEQLEANASERRARKSLWSQLMSRASHGSSADYTDPGTAWASSFVGQEAAIPEQPEYAHGYAYASAGLSEEPMVSAGRLVLETYTDSPRRHRLPPLRAFEEEARETYAARGVPVPDNADLVTIGGGPLPTASEPGTVAARRRLNMMGRVCGAYDLNPPSAQYGGRMNEEPALHQQQQQPIGDMLRMLDSQDIAMYVNGEVVGAEKNRFRLRQKSSQESQDENGYATPAPGTPVSAPPLGAFDSGLVMALLQAKGASLVAESSVDAPMPGSLAAAPAPPPLPPLATSTPPRLKRTVRMEEPSLMNSENMLPASPNRKSKVSPAPPAVKPKPVLRASTSSNAAVLLPAAAVGCEFGGGGGDG